MESWQENFRTIISSGVCAKSTDIHIIYSQMEYEHNFLENFILFYCTTLYFYCLNIILTTNSYVYNMYLVFCNLLIKKSVNKDKLLQCCRHCRFSIETVLVDVLEQDRQACYNAVTIAGF